MNERICFFLIATAVGICIATAGRADDENVTRVFIFAGQSNMVGSDSHVDDIKRFPPFVGLEDPQPHVKFSYCLGRENKTKSNGWVDLQPVNDVVGPELSFARQVSRNIDAPIAIIKCAAGGTHLGGDWNPDEPQGFKMYPLMLELIRSSLAEFDQRTIDYRIEGVMWHQGENDMFEENYLANYGKNLSNFLSRLRRDLKTPNLRFYIGELCTKTIWGMDLRPRMYAISQGQRFVTEVDPLADYVPTSHIGVEIGEPVGLHYHYGTLGQLQHGVNYATSYLRTIGKLEEKSRTMKTWPYEKNSTVKLFVFAGHRNMEGERAFVQQVPPSRRDIIEDNPAIAFKYSLGGAYRVSNGWEPLGPPGYYDTFGPELSFVKMLQSPHHENMAIAKYTDSGSQMNDWTPDGTMAKSRHVYPKFINFIQDALRELREKGHDVELAGIFYHVGENEMSMPPYRQDAAKWLQSTIEQSRRDLHEPDLKWYVSQQAPTDVKQLNSIDITGALEQIAAADHKLIHIKAFDLPEQPKKLVIDTLGVIRLGEVIAEEYRARQ